MRAHFILNVRVDFTKRGWRDCARSLFAVDKDPSVEARQTRWWLPLLLLLIYLMFTRVHVWSILVEVGK